MIKPDIFSSEHIASLLRNEVPESKVLDYKRELPSELKKDENKKKFLADVSAFANMAGGTLIYGISEKIGEDGKKTGMPKELVGVDSEAFESTKERMENILQHWVSPRILDIHIGLVKTEDEKCVVVINIPQSWNAPHMVSVGNLNRFYIRDNHGNHLMDVTEIRDAFLRTNMLEEKARQFRDTRLEKILPNRGPLFVHFQGPRVAIHLVPLSVDRPTVSVKEIYETLYIRRKDHHYFGDCRPNLDGLIEYKYWENSYEICEYNQFFRTGRTEAVTAKCLLARQSDLQNYRFATGEAFETNLFNLISALINVLVRLGFRSRFVLFVSVLGVSGLSITNSRNKTKFQDEKDAWENSIHANDLNLPELVIEDLAAFKRDMLKPMFDEFWNASGYFYSPNFAKES